MFTMVKKKHPPNWVRHFRKERGLSAQQLGDAVGMSKDGITFIERSERILTIANAKKIANVLEVHYIDIIDGPAENIVPANQKEKEMLEKYRQLNDTAQQRMLGYIESKVEENLKDENNS